MLRLRADDGVSRSSYIHAALNSDDVVNKSEMGHENMNYKLTESFQGAIDYEMDVHTAGQVNADEQ